MRTQAELLSVKCFDEGFRFVLVKGGFGGVSSSFSGVVTGVVRCGVRWGPRLLVLMCEPWMETPDFSLGTLSEPNLHPRATCMWTGRELLPGHLPAVSSPIACTFSSCVRYTGCQGV